MENNLDTHTESHSRVMGVSLGPNGPCMGTATLYDSSLALTAGHVVKDAPDDKPLYLWPPDDSVAGDAYRGKPIPAFILRRYPTLELALLIPKSGHYFPATRKLKVENILAGEKIRIQGCMPGSAPRLTTVVATLEGEHRTERGVAGQRFQGGFTEPGMSGGFCSDLNGNSFYGILLLRFTALSSVGVLMPAFRVAEIVEELPPLRGPTGVDPQIFPGHSVKSADIFISPKVVLRKYQSSTLACSIEDVPQDGLLPFMVGLLATNSNILFIDGPYGSGKSILLTNLAFEFDRAGYDVRAYQAVKLAGLVGHKPTAEILRPRPDKPMAVLVDSLDELTAITAVDPAESLLGSLREFQATNTKRVVIAISSRPRDKEYAANDENHNWDNLLLHAQNWSDSSECYYQLSLSYFGKDEVVAWLERFFNALEPNDASVELRRENLKIRDRHLPKVCEIPIFLFMLADAYYSTGARTGQYAVPDLYSLLESFVNMTCKGRFSLETRTGSRVLGKRVRLYRKFLSKIAVHASRFLAPRQPSKTFAQGRESIRRDPKTSAHPPQYESDYVLVSNDDLPLIPNETIGNAVRNVWRGDDVVDSNDGYLSLLNCYFLSATPSGWRFRDNNLITFFVAEHCVAKLHELSEAASAHQEQFEFIYDHIKDELESKLNPHVMDLVLMKLRSAEASVRSRMCHALRRRFERGESLSISSTEAVDGLGMRRIEADMFLTLLFLSLNERWSVEDNYIVKRLMWMVSAVKQIDKSYISITRRCFRRIQMSEIEMRRINFGEFDFSHSKFEGVKFIQCKLDDVRWHGSHLDKVCFELCELSGGNLDCFNPLVRFRHCRFSNVKLYFDAEAKARFEGCSFHNCSFISHGKHTGSLDCRVIIEDSKLDVTHITDFRGQMFLLNSTNISMTITGNCRGWMKIVEPTSAELPRPVGTADRLRVQRVGSEEIEKDAGYIQALDILRF